MRLARREQEVRVSDHQCSPAQFVLRPGGRVVISVQSGPQQSFSVGRDVEEAFVTPAIPAGGAYQWCAHCRCSTAPPLLGPHLPLLFLLPAEGYAGSAFGAEPGWGGTRLPCTVAAALPA
jgi:hypothetical protein